jgi:hypothetical protein
MKVRLLTCIHHTKKLKCCPIHDPDFYAEKEQEMDDLLARKAY